jgi:hypothetical protein
MSARGTIVRQRAAHLPIWPVAALLFVAVAMAIGLAVIDGLGRSEPVTDVRQREGNVSVIGDSAPTIQELPSGPFHAPGRAHEVILDEASMPVQRLYPAGFGK